MLPKWTKAEAKKILNDNLMTMRKKEAEVQSFTLNGVWMAAARMVEQAQAVLAKNQDKTYYCSLGGQTEDAIIARNPVKAAEQFVIEALSEGSIDVAEKATLVDVRESVDSVQVKVAWSVRGKIV